MKDLLKSLIGFEASNNPSAADIRARYEHETREALLDKLVMAARLILIAAAGFETLNNTLEVVEELVDDLEPVL